MESETQAPLISFYAEEVLGVAHMVSSFRAMDRDCKTLKEFEMMLWNLLSELPKREFALATSVYKKSEMYRAIVSVTSSRLSSMSGFDKKTA